MDPAARKNRLVMVPAAAIKKPKAGDKYMSQNKEVSAISLTN